MTRLFNPPFDNSDPCPACQIDLRTIGALIHNFLVRCDIVTSTIRERKAMVKLYDLKAVVLPETLAVPNPIVQAFLDVAKELQLALADMTQSGLDIRWTADTIDKVERLIVRAAFASDAYRKISEAHFADARHASGRENILRSEQGGVFPGHIRDPHKETLYNHTVTRVSEDGDISHSVCGSDFKLHPHFTEILSKDPTFYGKVWCETCCVETRWSQWDYHPKSDPMKEVSNGDI